MKSQDFERLNLLTDALYEKISDFVSFSFQVTTAHQEWTVQSQEPVTTPALPTARAQIRATLQEWEGCVPWVTTVPRVPPVQCPVQQGHTLTQRVSLPAGPVSRATTAWPTPQDSRPHHVLLVSHCKKWQVLCHCFKLHIRKLEKLSSLKSLL